MEIKRFTAQITKQIEGGKEVYTAWATRPTIDRDGEVVLPKGVSNLSEYLAKNPVVYYDHAWANWSAPTDTTLPIGKAISARIDKGGVITSFQFSDLPFAQQIKYLVDEGILNTLSIGFIGLQMVDTPEEIARVLKENDVTLAATPRRVWTKWEILEYSVVGIPSNRDAEIIRGASPEKTKEYEAALKSIRETESANSRSLSTAQPTACKMTLDEKFTRGIRLR